MNDTKQDIYYLLNDMSIRLQTIEKMTFLDAIYDFNLDAQSVLCSIRLCAADLEKDLAVLSLKLESAQHSAVSEVEEL